eukprot:g177.t1
MAAGGGITAGVGRSSTAKCSSAQAAKSSAPLVHCGRGTLARATATGDDCFVGTTVLSQSVDESVLKTALNRSTTAQQGPAGQQPPAMRGSLDNMKSLMKAKGAMYAEPSPLDLKIAQSQDPRMLKLREQLRKSTDPSLLGLKEHMQVMDRSLGIKIQPERKDYTKLENERSALYNKGRICSGGGLHAGKATTSSGGNNKHGKASKAPASAASNNLQRHRSAASADQNTSRESSAKHFLLDAATPALAFDRKSVSPNAESAGGGGDDDEEVSGDGGGAAAGAAGPGAAAGLDKLHRYTGVLKRYSTEHGKGFLRVREIYNETGRDVYVRLADLPGAGTYRCYVGQAFELNVVYDRNRQPRAANVTAKATLPQIQQPAGKKVVNLWMGTRRKGSFACDSDEDSNSSTDGSKPSAEQQYNDRRLAAAVHPHAFFHPETRGGTGARQRRQHNIFLEAGPRGTTSEFTRSQPRGLLRDSTASWLGHTESR